MSLEQESRPPATGLKKAQIPKSGREGPGKSAGKKGTAGGGTAESSHFLWKNRETALLPALPSSPLFPGTLPSTLPGTFGDLVLFSLGDKRAVS